MTRRDDLTAAWSSDPDAFEAFYRAYQAARGSLTAWLFGIAQFTVATRLRRSGRERHATLRVRGRELLDGDDLAHVDERLVAEAQARRLYAAMDRLRVGERAVLELIALDDFTPAEVAIALGLRPATVRVRLHRARRRMADALTAPETSHLLHILTSAKDTPS